MSIIDQVNQAIDKVAGIIRNGEVPRNIAIAAMIEVIMAFGFNRIQAQVIVVKAYEKARG
jgi:hypothetical protein